MDLSGNNKNKIIGKKYQPVMSVTGLNDQGLMINSHFTLTDWGSLIIGISITMNSQYWD